MTKCPNDNVHVQEEEEIRQRKLSVKVQESLLVSFHFSGNDGPNLVDVLDSARPSLEDLAVRGVAAGKVQAQTYA